LTTNPPVPRAPADAGLLRGIARRFDPRTLGVSALVTAMLVVVGGMGLVTPSWGAPAGAQLSRLVETAVTGFLVLAAVLVADELTDRGAPRAATYAFAVTAAALVGPVLGWHVRTATGLRYALIPGDSANVGPMLNAAHRVAHHLGMAIVGTIVGGLATFVHVSRRTALAARRRQHEAERARAQARRRTLESQLQALQARVEPMFLFDTLERIRALYRTDAAAAGAMLEDLIVYLRAALPHLRESASTVAQEFQLACSWLDIVGRTGPRWRVEVDVADDVRGARLPALVMLPLVQRAVTDLGVEHGLLGLSARMNAGCLAVEVSTASDAFGGGVAGVPVLEQIADRLQTLHAGAARLQCWRSKGATGSRATIVLPLELGALDAGATT
jgi:hypothetical protein